MLQLFPEFVEQIRAQALDCYPEEGAWLITKAGCYRVDNIAQEPTEFFDISESDVRQAHSEGLLAVVHSHTNGKHYPSAMDMQYQINTDVPWGILTCDGVASSRIRWWGGKTADQIEPLLDRTFCHATADCYALVRDIYNLNYGIQLMEFPREWDWWNTDSDLLRKSFKVAGFSTVKDDPRPGDVWLASFHSREGKLNHCGVLIDNDLAHHQPGAGTPVNDSKKATIEPIYRYLQYIGMWIRHKDMP